MKNVWETQNKTSRWDPSILVIFVFKDSIYLFRIYLIGFGFEMEKINWLFLSLAVLAHSMYEKNDFGYMKVIIPRTVCREKKFTFFESPKWVLMIWTNRLSWVTTSTYFWSDETHWFIRDHFRLYFLRKIPRKWWFFMKFWMKMCLKMAFLANIFNKIAIIDSLESGIRFVTSKAC